MLSALLSHGHDIRTPMVGDSGGLPCTALGAGYEQRINEHYSWDGLRRGTAPFLVVQHTTYDVGRLDHGGRSWRLTPGQTMLVSVPHAHRYWLERGGHWEYFWMILTGPEALRLCRAVLATRGPVIAAAPETVNRLAAACLSLLDGRAASPGQVATAAFAAMAALHDAAFAVQGAGRGAVPVPPPLARVVDHVAAHLAAPLPVERLAEIAGLCRAHFVRMCSAHLGVAPSAYVLEHRLERIERLLLATEMTVGEIAALTGFADGNYLAKAFRRRRGMAPLAFRATRAGAA